MTPHTTRCCCCALVCSSPWVPVWPALESRVRRVPGPAWEVPLPGMGVMGPHLQLRLLRWGCRMAYTALSLGQKGCSLTESLLLWPQGHSGGWSGRECAAHEAAVCGETVGGSQHGILGLAIVGVRTTSVAGAPEGTRQALGCGSDVVETLGGFVLGKSLS